MPVYSAELLKEQAIAKVTPAKAPQQPSPANQPEKKHNVNRIANRAQRGLDLPMIEEGVLGGEEEETIRAEKGGLYRPNPVDR